ncbi:MAG: hypothetical protein EOP06_06035 [Proteobacteria bacterium]|nr:MAG: hypothetical protein EOP06_06035 [Pseudomonadota bacterium]
MFLLFSKNMRLNFSKFYQPQVEKLEELLGAEGVERSVPRSAQMLKALGQIKSGLAFARMNLGDVSKLAHDMASMSDSFPNRKSQAALAWSSLAVELNSIVVQRQRIPFSWHEAPGLKIEPPSPPKMKILFGTN